MSNRSTTPFAPRNVWEIGVGPPQVCSSIRWMAVGIPTTLIDAHEENCVALRDRFKDMPHVKVVHAAIMSYDGEIELNIQGECSYVEGVASPTVVFYRDKEKPVLARVRMPCCSIRHFDDGDIDLLMIDVEGCEWQVISGLISRPRVISFEARMGEGSTAYTTPDLDLIEAWMETNGYGLAATDGSDVCYVKRAEMDCPS